MIFIIDFHFIYYCILSFYNRNKNFNLCVIKLGICASI